MPDELDTFKEAVKVIIEKEFPELVSPARHMLFAIVIDLKGAVVDLQVLAADGAPHPSFPPLPNVQLPPGLSLQIGQRVRIGFYYADPALPYIDGVTGDA
ncbi:hypothetical protein [Paenibacillus dendritiformis]|uniref:hypothetical protein n=1 Tax=Paenibacillus dendritiformis TaxID=130049 RepID=UPI000DAA1124|nr:hypothetical protein [Paenibacillus dendritiformis]PZM64860.1 hypothetical protein DOE73_14980 [Paenibacillus dendritiformis]